MPVLDMDGWMRRTDRDLAMLKRHRHGPGSSVGITEARPDPAVVGAGATHFDITLGKPLWSTGTAWVDATGTEV